MEPGGRDRIGLQRFQRDRPNNTVEMGGKQRIEDVPETVSVERSAG